MPIESRVLYVEHPDFGLANEDKGLRIYTNDRGITYVGAYWGSWDTYANLPADEVVVVEFWGCTWDTGYNTECGDPADEARDGFAYCLRHAIAYDLLSAHDEPDCYSDHNEDIRTKGSCDYCHGMEVQ